MNINVPRTSVRHNTFQSLLESPHIVPYSGNERSSRTIVTTKTYVDSFLLPALCAAALSHAQARTRALHRRLEKANAQGVAEEVTEALFDSHYRKQRNYGPSRDAVRKKVEAALAYRRPIELIGLMFTRKNICPWKRGAGDESVVDLAEMLSLVHLNAFAQFIANVHPYGAQLTILSEGKRFLKSFSLCEAKVRLYQERMQQLIEQLDLKNLTLIDYEDFLGMHIDQDKLGKRQEAYEESLKTYRDLMNPIFDPCDMISTLQKAVSCDPVLDKCNDRGNFVPLWDSIKNSIPYPELTQAAQRRGIEYEIFYREIFQNILAVHSDPEIETLRCEVLRKSWDAAIEHNAQIMGDVKSGIDVAAMVSSTAMRVTINPKPESQHLGIYSVRETTSRVQPWHGTAYLEANTGGLVRSTVLSKLELEARGALPVTVAENQGETFCYADAEAARILLSGAPIRFDGSTRK
ncbi:hypothetical protein EBR66_02345 [bacterium]|nr:hypothetical protein [bacterium]